MAAFMAPSKPGSQKSIKVALTEMCLTHRLMTHPEREQVLGTAPGVLTPGNHEEHARLPNTYAPAGQVIASAITVQRRVS